LLTAVAACGSGEEGTSGPSPASTATTTGAGGIVLHEVGEVIEAGPFEAVVHGVQEPLPPIRESARAPDGSHYAGIDLELRNRTPTPQTLSIVESVELKDSVYGTHDLSFTGHTPPPPNGEVPPGTAKRGLVVFQVKDGLHAERLILKGVLGFEFVVLS
jgi:hypothetical protein